MNEAKFKRKDGGSKEILSKAGQAHPKFPVENHSLTHYYCPNLVNIKTKYQKVPTPTPE